jgi:hypothetical protein
MAHGRLCLPKVNRLVGECLDGEDTEPSNFAVDTCLSSFMQQTSRPFHIPLQMEGSVSNGCTVSESIPRRQFAGLRS